MTNKRPRHHIISAKETTVRNAYTEFLNEKISLNVSQKTLNTYKIHIESFINFHHCENLSTHEISKTYYQDWITFLQNDPRKKDVTVASYCRSVRVFLYWMQDNQYTDPILLQIPKYQKTIKICYTNEELSKVLQKPNECSMTQYQTWVFINLVCATGIRLASALDLKVHEVIASEKCIYIQRTKNKKAQCFYLSDEMLFILERYINLFELNESDYIFCTGAGSKMAQRSMQDNVASFNRSHEVQKTSIHLFRHTFARNYYKQTKDIYSLSKILGHSSIATTEKYLSGLGLTIENATEYNPQRSFGNLGTNKTRRRKKNFPNKANTI